MTQPAHLPTFSHPSGRVYKLGRLAPSPEHTRRAISYRSLRKNVAVKLPDKTNYRDKARAVLHQMLMNDSLSCCGPAGSLHIEGLWRGNSFEPNIKFSNEQLLRVYKAVGGYVEGKPETDQGVQLPDLLNYWQKEGIYVSGAGGGKIVGYLSVDPTDTEACRECIFYFANLIGGYCLPDAWVSQENLPTMDGFIQNVAGEPNPNNGHCEVHTDYDALEDIFDTSTWGLVGGMTSKALAKYGAMTAGGELHVAISPDFLLRGSQVAPNALRWDDMTAKFADLGGDVSKVAHLIT